MDDGLVFYGIEGTGRVNESAAFFEELESADENVKLELMVLVTHMAVEVLPKTQILAHGTITTARHITENPIELEIFLLSSLLHVREPSCVIIGDHQRWQIELHHLMSQHERAFAISVVGYQHACIHPLLVLVQSLQDLDALGARRRAHVQDSVVLLNVEQCYRDH